MFYSPFITAVTRHSIRSLSCPLTDCNIQSWDHGKTGHIMDKYFKYTALGLSKNTGNLALARKTQKMIWSCLLSAFFVFVGLCVCTPKQDYLIYVPMHCCICIKHLVQPLAINTFNSRFFF